MHWVGYGSVKGVAMAGGYIRKVSYYSYVHYYYLQAIINIYERWSWRAMILTPTGLFNIAASHHTTISLPLKTTQQSNFIFTPLHDEHDWESNARCTNRQQRRLSAKSPQQCYRFSSEAPCQTEERLQLRRIDRNSAKGEIRRERNLLGKSSKQFPALNSKFGRHVELYQRMGG